MENYKILIAEDDESMGRLISYKLKSTGYDIKVVQEGDLVMKELKDNKYHLLILDLMLPVVNGIQILKKIKEEQFNINVLVLSARSQEKDIVNVLNLGADEYMTKPFRPDELLVRVKKILENKKWLITYII